MKLEKFSLEGKVALIVGSSSGIGRSSAELMAEAGASVFLVARREAKLREVKNGIEGNGGVCDYYAADAAIESNCGKAVDCCIERFGKLDILVNSGGINTGQVEQFDTENYNKVMRIDLDATFFMIKYAYPEMVKAGGGSIINISSSAAVKAMVDAGVPYTAAKGALKSLTRMWGKSMGPDKVRINSVYPGCILTEMTTGAFDNPELIPFFTKNIPLGYIGQADDIGYCVLYLASPASAYVTGQDFIVDGGLTC
jgi:NAD(P)-dependent dehydrogenase (short-subunit alcohol dehydrogenase family)